MDKESAQLFKVVVVGFAIIIAFLFWAAINETREPIVMLMSHPAFSLI